MTMSIEIDSSSPEATLAFYEHLYPFESIFKWLNQGSEPSKLFFNREFALTLQDAYLRYQTYMNAEDMKKKICNLNPSRFEIGPVYNVRPSDKRAVSKFHPVQRELVFDIDMTDYDPIRTCCQDADICRRCWGFIAAAVKVLDTSIREFFGYEQLLWVYSGRRGIHLWISDKEAMELSDIERKSMVNYLTVVHSGNAKGKKVDVRRPKQLPPSIAFVLEDLGHVFQTLLLEDQDCFASEEQHDVLLSLIPNVTVSSRLRNEWEADPTRSSNEKWLDFKAQVHKYSKGSPERVALKATMEDIILEYTYPRLDAEVSKHMNHLLKAPFCVHPKTGRICVPVDPSKVAEFDPEAVPTVAQLLTELDNAMEDGEKPGYDRTSLKPYVEMLDRHSRFIRDKNRPIKLDHSW